MRAALLFHFAALDRLEVLGVDDSAEGPGRVAGLAGALVELAGVMAEEPLQDSLVAGPASVDSGSRLTSVFAGVENRNPVQKRRITVQGRWVVAERRQWRDHLQRRRRRDFAPHLGGAQGFEEGLPERRAGHPRQRRGAYAALLRDAPARRPRRSVHGHEDGAVSHREAHGVPWAGRAASQTSSTARVRVGAGSVASSPRRSGRKAQPTRASS
jgi:hypothetical protein